MESDVNSNHCFYEKSFFDEYKERISPALKNIDILLRTGKFPLTVSETSKALNISNDEVFTILGGVGLSEIDRHCFLIIMKNGSSDICTLFKREIDCGSPYIYKPAEIAYIYGLDRKLVESVFCELYVTEVTERYFPAIFSRIPAKK